MKPRPKDPSADLKLAIAEILNRYEAEIVEAVNADSEVTLGGNGINSFEAQLTFIPLATEIRDALKP